MVEQMSSTNATRGGLHEAIAKARWRGEPTVLTVRGEPSAAVVSLEDFRRIQEQQPNHPTPPRAA